MDINGWLTVITVFTAIIALIPREDLKFLNLQIHRLEKYVAIFIIVFLIPYLIFFPEFLNRWPFLELLTCPSGFKSNNIAFALFFISFLWFISRMFLLKSDIRVDEDLINYYIELIKQKPFEEFFKLFTKYSSIKSIKSNWLLFRKIFFQSNFLNELVRDKTSYLLEFWDKLSKEEFRVLFKLFLENEQSDYYKEIRSQGRNYNLMHDKEFLNKILIENIEQSIDGDMLKIYSDYVAKHLNHKNFDTEIYNKAPYYNRIQDDQGFDLPLYYHIRFIGLLYISVIENRIDISALRSHNTNMQTIYSNIVEGMIENIELSTDYDSTEYPTNYHFLIGEIFSITASWMLYFNEEDNFVHNSSYLSFIPNSFGLCMNKLYSGFENGKITQDFVNNMIHYNILSYYYAYHINEEIKSSLLDSVIQRIPKHQLQPILNFSLNESFAISFDDLVNGNFNYCNSDEKETLNDLQKIVLELLLN